MIKQKLSKSQDRSYAVISVKNIFFFKSNLESVLSMSLIILKNIELTTAKTDAESEMDLYVHQIPDDGRSPLKRSRMIERIIYDIKRLLALRIFRGSDPPRHCQLSDHFQVAGRVFSIPLEVGRKW